MAIVCNLSDPSAKLSFYENKSCWTQTNKVTLLTIGFLALALMGFTIGLLLTVTVDGLADDREPATSYYESSLDSVYASTLP